MPSTYSHVQSSSGFEDVMLCHGAAATLIGAHRFTLTASIFGPELHRSTSCSHTTIISPRPPKQTSPSLSTPSPTPDLPRKYRKSAESHTELDPLTTRVITRDSRADVPRTVGPLCPHRRPSPRTTHARFPPNDLPATPMSSHAWFDARNR